MAAIIMAEAPVAIGYARYPDGQVSFYPLTPCCAASGKGWVVETGVVCRHCMEIVDAGYGCFWYANESTLMVNGYNIAGTWAIYTTLLEEEGIDPAKARQLTDEAKRQAATLVA